MSLSGWGPICNTPSTRDPSLHLRTANASKAALSSGKDIFNLCAHLKTSFMSTSTSQQVSCIDLDLCWICASSSLISVTQRSCPPKHVFPIVSACVCSASSAICGSSQITGPQKVTSCVGYPTKVPARYCSPLRVVNRYRSQTTLRIISIKP